MKKSITQEFAQQLRYSGFLYAVLQGISIPCQLLIASLTAKMVTSAVAGEGSLVLRQGGMLLCSVILYKLLETFLNIYYKQVLAKRRQKCRMRLYGWYLENPLHKLYSFTQGEFLERVTDDFNTVTGKFAQQIPLLWVNALAAVVYFLYVAVDHPGLALLFLLLSMVQIVPELAIRHLEERIYTENRDVEAEITEWNIAAYRGFSAIKNFGLTDWYITRLKKLHDDNLAIGRSASGISAVEISSQKLISYLLQYGVCIAAGLLVLGGNLSLGVGIADITISGKFFSAVKVLFTTIPEFSVAGAAQKRLEEWSAQSEDIRQVVPGSEIHLSDVSFAYGEKQLFTHKNESLDTAGIGLIKGENGCGKSTLLKLIAGLLACDDGHVAIGQEIVSTKEALTKGTGILYLSQERLHMDMTVTQYLALFPALDAKVLQRHLQDFGVGTSLLESRLNDLSGGEEKKIMLSILLSCAASLLLLDEPETSLDADGVKVLARKLKERGRGVLIVTHGAQFDAIADYIYYESVVM